MNLRGNIWLTKSRLNCNPADSNLLYLFKENELSLSCPYVKLDLTKSFWLTRWSWDHETWKGFYFILFFYRASKLEDEGADWIANLFYSSDWRMGRFGGRRYQFLFCRLIIVSKVGCCFNEKKIDAVGYWWFFKFQLSEKDTFIVWLFVSVKPEQLKYRGVCFPYKCLISTVRQLISESVSMRILTHLYALVHASTATCLYCNGSILWNRYKRQSPSLKLFRTLLKAIRNLDLRPKTKSYRFKNFGCRELT